MGKLAAAITAFFVLCTGAVHAQDLRIDELSALDRQFIMQQRALLDDLARSRLGRSFSGDRDDDLALLQTLLDRELVRSDQQQELQAMGVIMGDHLAEDLGMHWVVYQDKLGRSRALRYRDSDSYLFPMTMISRRREVGNMESVATIYDKARRTIEHSIPAPPFQQ